MKKSVAVFLSLCFILMSTGCGQRDVMSKEESDVAEVQESQSVDNPEESSDDSIDTSAADEPEQSTESDQPIEPEQKEFSIHPGQKEGRTDLYTTNWNNATGEAEREIWKWNGEEYVIE